MNFQHSCEVWQIGNKSRTIVYGLTRSEVVAQLALVFKWDETDAWMDEFVVTETKVLKMGLPPTWTRVSRGPREHY
jgi:hypothetical protein